MRSRLCMQQIKEWRFLVDFQSDLMKIFMENNGEIKPPAAMEAAMGGRRLNSTKREGIKRECLQAITDGG